MNFGPVTTLFTLLVLSCVIGPCNAQSSRIFQWQFGGVALSQNIPACRDFPITVKPFNPANNTRGVPPFYMMAFAVGGTVTNSLIGTDEANLKWTVNQPVGSRLLLTVVDSQGSSGGVPPSLFTVVDGQSTSCLPGPSSEPNFVVTANVTDTLNTCQPWGLTIKGGTPPYNVTLAAVNSPVVTNVTMGPTDDAFTFIDRADPGTQLLAAVSDLNGNWATGIPIVTTKGSTNTECIGLVSSSGSAAKIKADAQIAAAASKSSKKTAVIAGVVVTIVVLLLLAAGAVFFYMRRRKVQEITPRQFEAGSQPEIEDNGGQILSINAFISPGSPTQPRSPKSPGGSSFPQPASPFQSVPGSSRRGPRSIASSGMSVRNSERPAFTSFPAASIRRSAKEIEAGLATSNSMHSEFSHDTGSDISSRPLVERSQSAYVFAQGSSGYRGPARSASMGATESEIIYQHQDAGMLRELPPPYADRGRAD
ncbi:hypothetical protein B0H15DRAFT_865053 [Mycena belliarum]|uniref:Uncharacterized protein n=1 Tax=Mycena belliarum TaxID=1033014 RepID=A0AAD6XMS1_9AGAR|nr:hypothetical protein B0H15DRAFT_865053 [Mycena belliae]